MAEANFAGVVLMSIQRKLEIRADFPGAVRQ